MPVVRVTPVYTPAVRGLCVKAYPNHPKGCPNFGKKAGCPPQAPQLPAFYDYSREFYAIYNVFDFGSHVAKMKAAHPEWSQRQLDCCLYWQPTARKQLEAEIRAFSAEHPGMDVNRCPEAMGLNVHETMRLTGLVLEWPPVTKAVQVALAGWPQ